MQHYLHLLILYAKSPNYYFVCGMVDHGAKMEVGQAKQDTLAHDEANMGPDPANIGGQDKDHWGQPRRIDRRMGAYNREWRLVIPGYEQRLGPYVVKGLRGG